MWLDARGGFLLPFSEMDGRQRGSILVQEETSVSLRPGAKAAFYHNNQKLLLQFLPKVSLTVQKMPRKLYPLTKPFSFKHTTPTTTTTTTTTTWSSPRPGVSLQVKGLFCAVSSLMGFFFREQKTGGDNEWPEMDHFFRRNALRNLATLEMGNKVARDAPGLPFV